MKILSVLNASPQFIKAVPVGVAMAKHRDIESILLPAEGVDQDKIVLCGDVMYDTACMFGQKAREQFDICEKLGLVDKGFRLSTVRSQENTDDLDRLRVILKVLVEEAPVVLLLHPRAKQRCKADPGLAVLLEKLRVIEPVGFFDIVHLQQMARTVITDSGGMQKEAFFHGTPIVVLRDETEWTELVDLGWAKLLPPLDTADLLSGIQDFEKTEKAAKTNPYGDGIAADVIVETLLNMH